METALTPSVWRKSDQRLLNRAVGSFVIIFILGLLAMGLYLVSPQNTQILGAHSPAAETGVNP